MDTSKKKSVGRMALWLMSNLTKWIERRRVDYKQLWWAYLMDHILIVFLLTALCSGHRAAAAVRWNVTWSRTSWCCGWRALKQSECGDRIPVVSRWIITRRVALRCRRKMLVFYLKLLIRGGAHHTNTPRQGQFVIDLRDHSSQLFEDDCREVWTWTRHRARLWLAMQWVTGGWLMKMLTIQRPCWT